MEMAECLTLKDLLSPRKSKTDVMDEDGCKNEQKENICIERKKMTPLKNEASPAMHHRRGCTPEQIHITPSKHLDRNQAEPWTPTANLKMLISAASPDIRDREMKKSLFRPIENEKDEVLDDPSQFDVMDDCNPDEFEKQRPSRKLKSLGLLCQKFLALYPDYPLSAEKTNISLDEVAMSLGVERRRIYDIVNVLESLMLVSRVAKNQYCWHGRHQLCQTLEDLQSTGRRQRYEEQMAQIRDKDVRPAEPQRRDYLPEPPEDGGDSDIGSGSANRRKDKSLRIMSQKFVMLFLVSKTRIVTLDVAAKILIEESQDATNHSKYKTKVRRLYDIANVLTSLGLIKKVHVKEERGRKPAFKWIGPAEFQSSGDVEAVATIDSLPAPHPQLPGKPRLARHSSFHMLSTSVATQRAISSAPSSPHRDRKALTPEPVDYSRKTAVVCKLQFGENLRSQHCGGPKSSSVPPSPTLAPVHVPSSPDSHYESFPKSPSQPAFSLPRPELLLPRFYPSTAKTCAPILAMSSKKAYEEGDPQPHSPLVYFQNLSPASMVMLCGNGGVCEGVERVETGTEGHRSLGADQISQAPQQRSVAKRRLSGDAEEPTGKRDRLTHSEAENSQEKRLRGNKEPDCTSNTVKTPGCRSDPRPPSQEGGRCTVPSEEMKPRSPFEEVETGRPGPQDLAPPSHYLYVPTSAGLNGLNGLNFLLPAGHGAGGLTLSPNGLPALALPYVVVPSSALSPYPLLASGLPGANADLHGKGTISFNMPAMVSPARFVIGARPAPAPATPEFSPSHQDGRLPALGYSSPEEPRPLSAGNPDTPATLGPLSAFLRLQPQPQTPLTPKEARMAYPEAFFQTPGTLGSAVSSIARKRGHTRGASSAQRRLDIGNNTAN
ncbi:transcription factor E2F7 isoform X2 [Amia ocellicauda]|uniref:transcription factor E2F7 isoform X2 n=1 Tax=Amia ocellicauda TaxID=2972642 RepID=UPI003463D656